MIEFKLGNRRLSAVVPEMLEIPKEPSKEKERERLDNLTERMEMLSSTLARFSIFIDDNREKLKKDDFYRLGALSAKIEEVEKFFFDIWGEVPSRFPDYTTKDEG
jgi:negative regulator of sigma E activity